jgi:hypothetical protein
VCVRACVRACVYRCAAVSVDGSFDPPNGVAFDCVRPGTAAGAAVYPALSAKNMTVSLNLGLDPARPLRFAPPWAQGGPVADGGAGRAAARGSAAVAAVPRLRAGDAVRMRAELGPDGQPTGGVTVFYAAAAGGSEVEVRMRECACLPAFTVCLLLPPPGAIRVQPPSAWHVAILLVQILLPLVIPFGCKKYVQIFLVILLFSHL